MRVRTDEEANSDIEDLLRRVNATLDLMPKDKDERLFHLSRCFVQLRDELSILKRPKGDKHFEALQDKLLEVTNEKRLLISEMNYEYQKSL